MILRMGVQVASTTVLVKEMMLLLYNLRRVLMIVYLMTKRWVVILSLEKGHLPAYALRRSKPLQTHNVFSCVPLIRKS